MNKTKTMNRKAVSTVLASIIMIGMITTTISGFFLAQQTYTSQYQFKVKEVAEHNRLIGMESFKVSGHLTANELIVSVQNKGGNPTEIILLFINDGVIELSPTAVVNAAEVTDIPSGLINPLGKQSIKVLSALGNTASAIFPEEVNLGDGGASFVGPLKIEFGSFNYYQVNAPGNKVDNLVLSSGTLAYTIDTNSLIGNYVAFSLQVTNKDPAQRTIVLGGNTNLFDTQIGPSSTKVWYMAQIDAVGNLTPYQDVTLNFGDTVTLWFVTGSPASDDGSKAFSPGTQVTSFLVFHGTIAGLPWGQNSPFVTSVYV